MTFNEILAQDAKEVTWEVKLDQLADLVTTIRHRYGNADANIEVPFVSTADGKKRLTYLTAGDKVALAKKAIGSIVAVIAEHTEVTEGSVFDREFESLVATNPVLCNLKASTGSSYL